MGETSDLRKQSDAARAMLAGLRVAPGDRDPISRRSSDDRLGLSDKEAARERVGELTRRLAVLQNRLYAESRRAVLLVLQGLDASGKDGTIRTVFSGVNPQGVQVASFKAPTPIELAHDFLWRIHAACPERGDIGIFNRSHYEDLVTVFVKKIGGRHDDDWWKGRVRAIKDFERHLVDEGTVIIKCFLHVSAAEQRKRFAERMNDPEKAWKFRINDLEDAEHFGEFVAAYDRALGGTSTKAAPWYVIPGDRNWVRNVAISELLVTTLVDMNPQLPPPSPELLAARAAAIKEGPIVAEAPAL
jgi:PPK2 family polyphosphate:nucleotide phosphotransferase